MAQEPTSSTLDRIHAAAEAEFLEKGYQSASLRQIVKSAGVTTGAFYGYYESKEALFAALVEELYRHVLDTYHDAVFRFEALRPSGRSCRWETRAKPACRSFFATWTPAVRPST